MKVLLEVTTNDIFGSLETESATLQRWRELFRVDIGDTKAGTMEIFHLPRQLIRSVHQESGKIKWYIRAPKFVEEDINEILEDITE